MKTTVKKGIIGALFAMMASIILTVAFAATPAMAATADVWNVSKSKTATNLDENFESKVTLSLPSAQQNLDADVVFVLDKSTSAQVEDQALGMLQQLQEQIKGTDTTVKVGVVIFNKVANVSNFMDLSTEYGKIEAAIRQDIKSGTNTHAGMLAGKEMLDEDQAVKADRKYLIFVSDGITYMYNAEPTATAWSFMGDSVNIWAGPENWEYKYGNNDAPADGWAAFLQNIGEQYAKQGAKFEYPYGKTATESTPVKDYQTYANSIDIALYNTDKVYKEAAAAGYHCYAVNTGTSTDYQWGPSFMSYLAGGNADSFANIQEEILYLVDNDSKVVDYMGYVEDDYNFDLVGLENMTLTVGDDTYKAEKISDTKYGFKPAGNGNAFTVEYVKGNGLDEEHFVWNINEPISNFAHVKLTYTVKLVNPKTEPGTYGKYDEDGSKLYDGLYTNNSATLCPVNTAGTSGASEDFAKPTVSYTVAEAPVVPEEPAKPEQPEKPAKPTKKPSGNLPQTGDDVMAAVVLTGLVGAGAGVAYVSRRRA